MPELPDLEVFSRNLNQFVKGKQVKQVIVSNQKKVNVTEAELHKALEKQKVERVYRAGKELYISFSNGHILGLHLMLNGEFQLSKEEDLPRYTILRLCFRGGLGMALTDRRQLAHATLDPVPDETVDALDKRADHKYFEQLLASRKTAIKNVLLDQNAIRGIGNAYADEILWEAAISPFSLSHKIPANKLKALSKAIRHVLERAIKKIESSHPDLISGEVRDFLNIHNPEKKHSPSGVPIKVAEIRGRKTYYTDEQELFK